MLITDPQFFKAVKDKNLSLIKVILENGAAIVRLTIDVKNEYDNSIKDWAHVEAPTHVEIENYSHWINDTNTNHRREVKTMHFAVGVYRSSYYNHVNTFLSKIRKDKDIRFKLVAYNSNENLTKAGFVHHTLYGIIGGKDTYMLADFVGPEDTSSPVNTLPGWGSKTLAPSELNDYTV